MMLGGLGSDLNLGGFEKSIWGFGLSISEWVVSSVEGWELVLVFWKGFPCFGPWLP